MNKIRCVEAANMKKKKEDWELDPSKLTVGHLIDFGGYGAVYKGIYDDKEVAGIIN